MQVSLVSRVASARSAGACARVCNCVVFQFVYTVTKLVSSAWFSAEWSSWSTLPPPPPPPLLSCTPRGAFFSIGSMLMFHVFSYSFHKYSYSSTRSSYRFLMLSYRFIYRAYYVDNIKYSQCVSSFSHPGASPAGKGLRAEACRARRVSAPRPGMSQGGNTCVSAHCHPPLHSEPVRIHLLLLYFIVQSCDRNRLLDGNDEVRRR